MQHLFLFGLIKNVGIEGISTLFTYHPQKFHFTTKAMEQTVMVSKEYQNT
jgi:hypothetical protein